MDWGKLALLLLTIARYILEQRKNSVLIEAGRNEADKKRIEKEMGRIQQALDAARSVPVDPDNLRTPDKYSRD